MLISLKPAIDCVYYIHVVNPPVTEFWLEIKCFIRHMCRAVTARQERQIILRTHREWNMLF
jgi:hypothetical protein